MKISQEKPPNWDKLVELFGVEWGTVVVTWGDTCHCGVRITDDTMWHEMVHQRQQREIGIEEWWRRFYVDTQFRYEQELEAYREQYQWMREREPDRNKISVYGMRLASYLSGKMYGSIVSQHEAFVAITRG